MIADASVRIRALEHSGSFIVQAPAGSGKTTLLVSRYLKLLTIVQKPEEILAITFTRKAAAEMRKRVLEQLPKTSALAPRAGEIAHRLRIMTMDAFCASLTRQMPILARFGAQPGIVEDAAHLYRQAALRTLSAFDNPHVQKILGHLDNDLAAAAELLAAMLAKRDQWLRNAGNPPTRAQLEAVLLTERERLLSAARKIDLRCSEEFAREVLIQSGEWRKRPKPAPADMVGNEALRCALKALLAMPPDKYDDAQWEALAAILALLIPAVQQLVAEFSLSNEVDFTQIAHGALQALGSADDPSELLLSLDARVSHLLVDEFQDTSVSQWTLLERLTAGWQEGDGRTVFGVGDPMQSIYRFREAEVGLFLRAWHEGLGGVRLEALTLSTNFRSQAGIVEWLNGCFPKVLPANDEKTSGAVPYAPATTHQPAQSGTAVTWHCFYEREFEARKVVQLVKAATGKVAILVRNRSHLDVIVPALKDAGIRYRAVEIETLGDKQVVQDLYALARALAHPADRVAWLAILRAPWLGLELSEMSALFENKNELSIWQLIQDASSSEFPALTRLRQVLAPALANRLRGSLRAHVEGVWLALGGPACVQEATDLEDAEIFLDELERLEAAGGLPELKILQDKLDKLWALPDVGAGPDAVEIMTIHKAKGLEFDTVIVPGLDRAPRSGERPLLAWKALSSTRQRGPGLLLAPINASGAGKEPLYDYVRNLDKEAEDLEAGRLFYVAATRARSRLHLLACATTDKEGAIRPPHKRSLLAKAWFEAVQHFPPAPANAEPALANAGPALVNAGPALVQGTSSNGSASSPASLRRLPATYRLPPPLPPVVWGAPTEGRELAEEIEFSWAGECARHVGSVVHRWLQRIAEDELKGWDAKRVASLGPRFKQALERHGVQASELMAASALVTTALQNTLADERGRWVLGAHAESKSEHRIRTPNRSYVVDRYFRDVDGVRWVVDFKTGRHEGGDPEAFLDVQRQRYQGQLDAYATVLGAERRGLYFPLLPGWRAWGSEEIGRGGD